MNIFTQISLMIGLVPFFMTVVKGARGRTSTVKSYQAVHTRSSTIPRRVSANTLATDPVVERERKISQILRKITAIEANINKHKLKNEELKKKKAGIKLYEYDASKKVGRINDEIKKNNNIVASYEIEKASHEAEINKLFGGASEEPSAKEVAGSPQKTPPMPEANENTGFAKNRYADGLQELHTPVTNLRRRDATPGSIDRATQPTTPKLLQKDYEQSLNKESPSIVDYAMHHISGAIPLERKRAVIGERMNELAGSAKRNGMAAGPASPKCASEAPKTGDEVNATDEDKLKKILEKVIVGRTERSCVTTASQSTASSTPRVLGDITEIKQKMVDTATKIRECDEKIERAQADVRRETVNYGTERQAGKVKIWESVLNSRQVLKLGYMQDLEYYTRAMEKLLEGQAQAVALPAVPQYVLEDQEHYCYTESSSYLESECSSEQSSEQSSLSTIYGPLTSTRNQSVESAFSTMLLESTNQSQPDGNTEDTEVFSDTHCGPTSSTPNATQVDNRPSSPDSVHEYSEDNDVTIGNVRQPSTSTLITDVRTYRPLTSSPTSNVGFLEGEESTINADDETVINDQSYTSIESSESSGLSQEEQSCREKRVGVRKALKSYWKHKLNVFKKR